MVKFSQANTKIKNLAKVKSIAAYLRGGRKVYSFDILSGWSCPYAKDCLSKVHVIDGKRKVIDGQHTQFRCFSASQEALFTNVYNLRKRNYDVMRKASIGGPFVVATILDEALPKDAGIVRCHVGGDFFNRDYFMGWLWLAVRNPHTLFYAYTKSLKFWVDNREFIPDNFILTASRGGRLDYLINKHNLREAVVVFSEKEAKQKKLPIDKDDSHAACPKRKHESFALILHGQQPKNSIASKALIKLNGKGSYSRKK